MAETVIVISVKSRTEAEYQLKTAGDTSFSWSGGKTTVTCLQNGGQPGIYLKKEVYLEPFSTYEMIVLARTTANVILDARDLTNSISLNDGLKRVSDDDNANVMFITNRSKYKVRCRLGILFESPADMGDSFTVEYIALVKRPGQVYGNWRNFEIDDIVLTDKYSGGEWYPTATTHNNN
jgi:hypothetical protein